MMTRTLRLSIAAGATITAIAVGSVAFTGGSTEHHLTVSDAVSATTTAPTSTTEAVATTAPAESPTGTSTAPAGPTSTVSAPEPPAAPTPAEEPIVTTTRAPRRVVCFALTRPPLPGQPADTTPVAWVCHYEDTPGTTWQSSTDDSGLIAG